MNWITDEHGRAPPFPTLGFVSENHWLCCSGKGKEWKDEEIKANGPPVLWANTEGSAVVSEVLLAFLNLC